MFRIVSPRLLVIAFFIGLNLVLGSYFLIQAGITVPEPVLMIMQKVGVIAENDRLVDRFRRNNVIVSLNNQDLMQRLNQARAEDSLDELVENELLKRVAQEMIAILAKENYDFNSPIFKDQFEESINAVDYKYSLISHNSLVGPMTVDGVLNAWLGAESPENGVMGIEFSEYGLVSQVIENREMGRVGVIVLILAQPQNSAQIGNRESRVVTRIHQPPPPREIPDSEVIEALNNYRAVHGRPPLQVNEHLCQYAQKRVGDLIAHGGLDEHAGFERDFANPSESPPAIEEYQGTTIGENLAQQYCRNMQTGESFVANTGTSLIEWCFDSSTQGHREAQLSTQFKNVCVRHGQNMYVVIFGD